MSHRNYYNTIEHYSGGADWNGNQVNYACYPRGRICNVDDDDSMYAHIPRAINPASPLADIAQGSCKCSKANRGPLISCFDPTKVCKKNCAPYDSKADLIIAPYSMAYDTSCDCKKSVCHKGQLTCTSRHRGAMYNGTFN